MQIVGSASMIHRLVGSYSVFEFGWIATAGGDVQFNMDYPIRGRLVKVETIPGSVSETYNASFVNARTGFDALNGQCTERSISATEMLYIGESASPGNESLPEGQGEMIDGEYDFKVTSAGNASHGTCRLYMKVVE